MTDDLVKWRRRAETAERLHSETLTAYNEQRAENAALAARIAELEAKLADLEEVDESLRGMVRMYDHYKAKFEAAEARIAEQEERVAVDPSKPAGGGGGRPYVEAAPHALGDGRRLEGSNG